MSLLEVRLVVIAGPPAVPPKKLGEACLAAEAGGATAVQVRWKNATARELVEITGTLVETLSIPVFVNDRADVAWAAGAHGVHVGADDVPARAIRTCSTRPVCIGVSVGDATEARDACRAEADYWSVGPVFATTTKPDAGPAFGLEGFRALAALAPAEQTVIAIGGIDQANAGEILEAGAQGIAVSRAVFDGENVERATRALRTAVDAALPG